MRLPMAVWRVYWAISSVRQSLKSPHLAFAAGLTLAALHGIFSAFLGAPAWAECAPWGDLWIAAFLSVLLLILVFWLVGRANEDVAPCPQWLGCRCQSAIDAPQLLLQPLPLL